MKKLLLFLSLLCCQIGRSQTTVSIDTPVVKKPLVYLGWLKFKYLASTKVASIPSDVTFETKELT